MRQSIGTGAFSALAQDLDLLSSQSRFRRLARRDGRDFASNDYLGLAGSQELANAAHEAIERGVPIGSGGSRLLRGNHEEHEALESEAAAFFGSEAALFFATGYAANSAILSTLPQKGDLVIHDALIHASAREGLKLSRAGSLEARHNDLDQIEDLARDWRRNWQGGTLWIAIESLYSMDGDQAPLGELMAIADRYDAVLIVDEAHATGVFGREGRGLAERIQTRENVITLRTCGKALGSEGALVCGPNIVRDFLINRARGFIFSTAPSPVMAAVARSALRLVQADDRGRERLWDLISLTRCMFAKLAIAGGDTQIQPIILGDNARTMRIAAALREQGFDVRGIRPPTVPKGTARLRVSINLNVRAADIEALGRALELLLLEVVGK